MFLVLDLIIILYQLRKTSSGSCHCEKNPPHVLKCTLRGIFPTKRTSLCKCSIVLSLSSNFLRRATGKGVMFSDFISRTSALMALMKQIRESLARIFPQLLRSYFFLGGLKRKRNYFVPKTSLLSRLASFITSQ